MTKEMLASWVRSTAISVAATAATLAILIVVAEEMPALKDWLKQTFYHHWLGKGALAIALFIIVSIFFRTRRDAVRLNTIVHIETIAVILASSIITGFFLLHTLNLI